MSLKNRFLISKLEFERLYLDQRDFRIMVGIFEVWDDFGVIIWSQSDNIIEVELKIHNATEKPFFRVQHGVITDLDHTIATQHDFYVVPFEYGDTLYLSKSNIRAIYPNSWATVKYSFKSNYGKVDDGFIFDFQLHTKLGVYNYKIDIGVERENRLFGDVEYLLSDTESTFISICVDYKCAL